MRVKWRIDLSCSRKKLLPGKWKDSSCVRGGVTHIIWSTWPNVPHCGELVVMVTWMLTGLLKVGRTAYVNVMSCHLQRQNLDGDHDYLIDHQCWLISLLVWILCWTFFKSTKTHFSLMVLSNDHVYSSEVLMIILWAVIHNWSVKDALPLVGIFILSFCVHRSLISMCHFPYQRWCSRWSDSRFSLEW